MKASVTLLIPALLVRGRKGGGHTAVYSMGDIGFGAGLYNDA